MKNIFKYVILFFAISCPALVSASQWQSLGQHSGSEYFFDKNSISGTEAERLITIKRNHIEGNFVPMSQEFKSKVIHTFVNGNHAYNNGTLNENSRGKRLLFDRK